MSKTINDLNKSLTQVITPNAIGAATNSDLNTVKNNIGTVSNLQTTDKTIVGAINELFQSANNGKQLIANAIGEPLDSNDTFSAMSNDINGLLSTFKTNMMNNGITVEANDRFKSLIDKIATMVEEGSGKGIRIAAGKKSSSSGTRAFYRYANSGYVSLPYLEFSKSEFSFVPNVVVAFRNSTTSSSFYSIYAKINEHSFSCSVTSKNTGNSYAYLRLSDVTDIAYVPVYMNHTSYQYDYIAIGVGEEDTTLRDSLASILENKGVDVTEEDDMATLIEYINKCSFDADVVNMGGNTVNLKSSTTGKYIFNHSIGHTNYKFNYDITGSYSYTTDTTKYASVPFEGNLGMSDITKTLTHTKSFNMWASDNYGSLDTTITITKYNDKVEFDFTIKNNSKNVVINALEYVISSSIIIYMK